MFLSPWHIDCFLADDSWVTEADVRVPRCELHWSSWRHVRGICLGFLRLLLWSFVRRCRGWCVVDHVWHFKRGLCVGQEWWDDVQTCYFGNMPGVLCQIVRWCVHAFDCMTHLEEGFFANVVGSTSLTLWIAGRSSWPMPAITLCSSPSTLCCGTAGGGLPEIYESRCHARSLRALRVLALHLTVSKFSWSSDDSSRTWL
jgi:hypothetical protein